MSAYTNLLLGTQNSSLRNWQGHFCDDVFSLILTGTLCWGTSPSFLTISWSGQPFTEISGPHSLDRSGSLEVCVIYLFSYHCCYHQQATMRANWLIDEKLCHWSLIDSVIFLKRSDKYHDIHRWKINFKHTLTLSRNLLFVMLKNTTTKAWGFLF